MYFFIKNYGCQMNEYDSLRMADLLIDNEYIKTDVIENADLAIFNTCSIREKADEKLFSDLGRTKLIKESKNGKLIIVVTGCVAQLQSDSVMKRAPYVDIVLGPQDIHLITDKIKNLQESKNAVSISSCAKDKFESLSSNIYDRSVSEYITVQEGCNNFCTYCVVPYTRGREFSRDAADIISEAKNLVSSGVKEITLLGQNVNSYNGIGINGKTWDFARLLFECASIDGLKRLKYTTSNPKDITDDIGKAHRDIDILVPFIHLPVQSGSNNILKRMNRKYTSDEYLKCIDLLRNYRNDIAFSSDFIVGFPGETDEDFAKTIDIVNQVKYAQAYSFKYSPRPNTPAAKMIDQIDEGIKAERLQILQELLNKQQTEFNKDSVGKCLNVLFTKRGKYEGQLTGRSEYSQAVTVANSSISIGDIVRVTITESVSHSLLGVIE